MSRLRHTNIKQHSSVLSSYCSHYSPRRTAFNKVTFDFKPLVCVEEKFKNMPGEQSSVIYYKDAVEIVENIAVGLK